MLRNLLTLFVILVLFSSAMIGCVSVKSHLQYANRSKSKIPTDAFAFVSVRQVIKPDKCLPSEKFEECEEIINDLPPIIQKGSGSGMLVWAKGKPVFLTAAHVCLDDLPDVYAENGMSFTLNKKSIIKVLGTQGAYIDTEIIKVNEKTDLCALSVPKMISAPVKVSHKPPKVGDKVYAVSAPYGIHEPTMTLVFSGHYSGYGKKWHYYTIPTRPGSSGSIVLDKNYRAIGMLNAAFVHIEHIGLGAGHEEIVEFLSEL